MPITHLRLVPHVTFYAWIEEFKKIHLGPILEPTLKSATYGTLSPPSMNRLYTLGAAASIVAVESEQSSHSHSYKWYIANVCYFSPILVFMKQQQYDTLLFAGLDSIISGIGMDVVDDLDLLETLYDALRKVCKLPDRYRKRSLWSFKFFTRQKYKICECLLAFRYLF